jgi:hypothetical protein
VAEAKVVDVVARFAEIGFERGPIKHRHAGDIKEVVVAANGCIVLDKRLAEGIDGGTLEILERE